MFGLRSSKAYICLFVCLAYWQMLSKTLYQHTYPWLGVHFLPVQLFNLTPNRSVSRFPLLTKRKDLWFSSQLACPVVLRKMMCGEDGDICRCSCHIIPKVTDLEYDHLIGKQLSRVDQIIVVCVFSAKREDRTIEEVTDLYKEMNKCRNMPCIQVSGPRSECRVCLLVRFLARHPLKPIEDHRRTFGSPSLSSGIITHL